jgi:hypothetical protein
MATSHHESIAPRTDLFYKRDVGQIAESIKQRGRYTVKRGGATITMMQVHGGIQWQVRTEGPVISDRSETIERAAVACNKLLQERRKPESAIPEPRDYNVRPRWEEFTPYKDMEA